MRMRATILALALLCTGLAAPAQARLSTERILGGLTWMSGPPSSMEINSKCTDPASKRLSNRFTALNKVRLQEVVLNVQNMPDSLGQAGVLGALAAASDTWNSEVNACARPDRSNLNFVTTGIIRAVPLPEDDGLNSVIFNSGLCEQATHVACAIMHVNPATDEPLGWDIVLDPLYPWGFGRGPWLDVQNVLTHELGHISGLDHPGTQSITCETNHLSLTMYACTWPGDLTKRVLGLGDALGLEGIHNA